MAAKKEQEIIQQTIQDIFQTLGIEAEFETVLEEDQVGLNVTTQDTGIIIGYHGEVLEALQTILSLVLSKKLGRFIRVTMEVGDYRKNRTEWLENLAKDAKEKALSNQEEVPLPQLKSWERRIVHMFFQDDPEVISESTGEGKDRMLVIRPK